LALLGGIQFNLSSPLASVFLPLKFTTVKKDTAEKDLMPDLLNQLKSNVASNELLRRKEVFSARQMS